MIFSLWPKNFDLIYGIVNILSPGKQNRIKKSEFSRLSIQLFFFPFFFSEQDELNFQLGCLKLKELETNDIPRRLESIWAWCKLLAKVSIQGMSF
jgi:hypothetical protein